jgi:hypothetical protein
LADAARVALGDPLSVHGFRLTESRAGNRGASVAYANECITISVLADWLEGELMVEISPIGEAAIPLEDIVDVSQAKGLSLKRLPRGIKRAALERRLGQVRELLESQVLGLLDCSEGAVTSLLRGGS